MKVLIIEDERLASEKLISLLYKIDENIDIIDVLETVEESINWFSSHSHPDLIFMDIQLNDGVCFEIFESVKIEKPIIFTTAFNEYAIQAFKVNSVDYLLKPIKINDLRRSVEKYKTLFSQPNYHLDLKNILKQFQKKFKERFFVKVGQHYKSILCSDIFCFYISERCTFIFTSIGRSYAIDQSLEQVEKMVDPEYFFRVNRNFIVNINSIQEIVSYSTSRLKLKLSNWDDPEDILVSRDRVQKFKQWMDR